MPESESQDSLNVQRNKEVLFFSLRVYKVFWHILKPIHFQDCDRWPNKLVHFRSILFMPRILILLSILHYLMLTRTRFLHLLLGFGRILLSWSKLVIFLKRDCRKMADVNWREFQAYLGWLEFICFLGYFYHFSLTQCSRYEEKYFKGYRVKTMFLKQWCIRLGHKQFRHLVYCSSLAIFHCFLDHVDKHSNRKRKIINKMQFGDQRYVSYA